MRSYAPGVIDNCPFCDFEVRERAPYPGQGRAGLHFDAIAICQSCAGGFAIPRPTQGTLDQFYESGVYWAEETSPIQVAHEHAQGFHRVRWCLRQGVLGHDVRVADIGAGHGGIPRALQGNGIRVASYVAVEPDPIASQSIGGLDPGFPVAVVEKMAHLHGQFDMVFLNHVLEHVADPHAFTRSVMKFLKPGATLYVEVPHADHHHKADVFPHTLFLGRSALQHLGQRLNLEVLAMETFGARIAPKYTAAGLTQRLASRMLGTVATTKLSGLSRMLDGLIWDYDQQRDDGAWLRSLLRMATLPTY